MQRQLEQPTIGISSATGTIHAATGLRVNLIWNNSALIAPSAFRDAVTSAARQLEQSFSDKMVVNIRVGWGEVGGTAISGSNTAAGGAVGGLWASYDQIKSLLAGNASGTTDQAVLNALSANQDPNGNGQIGLWRAQAKALGVVAADDTGLDGSIGFSTDFSGNMQGAALQMLTRAMGRMSGGVPSGIEDLLRYGAPGVHRYTAGQAAYFSVDGGVTRLANFSASGDPSAWANDGLTANDPFDASELKRMLK